MKKERILKKDWEEFLKAFNAEHQFRPIRIKVGENEISKNLPFMGLVYEQEKKEVELFTGGIDIEHPAHVIHTLKSPRAIYLLREDGEIIGIEVHSAREPKIVIEFIGSREDAKLAKKALIEKIAYEFYLKRGGEHGKDLDDWLKAERLVEKIAKLYV